MKEALAKYFLLEERNSRISVELLAGLTTFMTMAYIIFLQPMILSGRYFNMVTGMDYGALLTATCVVSAAGCLLMGLVANYPIALAPGMGENFFFVLSVLPVCSAAALAGPAGGWRLALGVVLVSGVIFAVLSFCNIRKLMMSAISPSLQKSIAAGIGLFIALLGLEHGGVIVCRNGHFEMSCAFSNPAVIIFAIGLAATAAMQVLKVRGSILLGILVSAVVAALFGKIRLSIFPVSLPPDISPVFAKADVAGVFKFFWQLLPFIIIFTFMDVFDTLGTLVGVCTQAKLMRGSELPNSTKAFACDAGATVAGAFCGHSTVTSYIESAAGVQQGGRTGLTAVTAGFCFLAAAFFAPLIGEVASCAAVTAPALIVVGAMMMNNAREIDWDDYSEAVPSFLILIGIPFTYSIADGLALGFIAYPLIKAVSGKSRSIGWLTYLIGAILILYLVLVRMKVSH